MPLAYQKTVIFILFILIGILLKPKFRSIGEVSGIKNIILNLALPATIFIALMGIRIDSDLLVLPLLALLLNILLFTVFPVFLPFLGIKKNSPDYRTARLLIPSLAPGLSSFPFVLEYLGEQPLAKIAMADLGNKIFVLLILYIVAMNWHFKRSSKPSETNISKLKSLGLSMVSEPVNLLILLALILVSFGFSLESLPYFISDSFQRLSTMMTPLVLLFIGLSVSFKKQHFVQLASLLLVRAGIVAFLCGVCIVVTGIHTENEILLLLAFGLSACSFWPYAHITTVEGMEEKVALNERTFNGKFALNLLALSFPLSTVLVIGVLSNGTYFVDPIFVFGFSLGLLILGLVPTTFQKMVKTGKRPRHEKEEALKYKVNASNTLWEHSKGTAQ